MCYSIGSNELMGCTAIGSSFIGIGRDHWLEMLDNPRKPVAQWYPLLESVPGNVPLTTSDTVPVGLSCLNGRWEKKKTATRLIVLLLFVNLVAAPCNFIKWILIIHERTLLLTRIRFFPPLGDVTNRSRLRNDAQDAYASRVSFTLLVAGPDYTTFKTK